MSVNTKQRIGEDIWKLKTEKIVISFNSHIYIYIKYCK